MNTGIQDAANLAWKLATVLGRAERAGQAGPAEPAEQEIDEALLDSYARERAPVARDVLRFTNRMFTVATASGRAPRFVRATLLPPLAPLVLRLRSVRAAAFRAMSQLAIGYRSSPLSVDAADAPRRGPRAGDRLPDGPVIENGAATTLHACIAAPGFHLLLCGRETAWPHPRVADLRLDQRGTITVHRLTFSRPVPPVLLLVRPDGYIAYRGGLDLDACRSYLDTWMRATV